MNDSPLGGYTEQILFKLLYLRNRVNYSIVNRVSRGNPSPFSNQYFCFCFTYQYLFLAVLFLLDFDPVEAWWVPEQCWCSEERLSGECFLAEMESLLGPL